MKKIYSMLMALAAATMIFSSCTDGLESYFTADEDDYPRILNTDIPEATGGGRAVLPAITRDNNFKFDVVVTPAQYTTVTWFVDGEQVFEGKSIDYSLIAGVYDVDIVATTTKGKSTKRMCSLEVLPLDGDPALADDAKSHWCQIGTQKTISVSNFDGITAAYIGGHKLTDFAVAGSKVTFTVPELAEGVYKFVVETADGKQFGCGNVTVSSEEYVDPGETTVTIWEGDVDINWGDSNVQLHDELAEIPVGAKLIFQYEMIDADYHCIRITNNDWSQDILGQVDNINETNPESFEIEYTAEAKDITDASCMLVTGFGYKLKSVVAKYGGGGTQTITLWTGDVDINWGDSNVQLHDELANVPVGAKIVYHYQMIDADYHCIRVTNNDWSQDILGQVDNINETNPESFEIEYTADVKAIADASCMLITGFGYKLTSVTAEVGAPSETIVWEGGVDINWGDSNVQLHDELADVKVGSTVVFQYEMIDADYHCIRVTNNDWTKDILPQVDNINETNPESFEIRYTEDVKAITDESCMLITGFGYKLKKVIVK